MSKRNWSVECCGVFHLNMKSRSTHICRWLYFSVPVTRVTVGKCRKMELHEVDKSFHNMINVTRQIVKHLTSHLSTWVMSEVHILLSEVFRPNTSPTLRSMDEQISLCNPSSCSSGSCSISHSSWLSLRTTWLSSPIFSKRRVSVNPRTSSNTCVQKCANCGFIWISCPLWSCCKPADCCSSTCNVMADCLSLTWISVEPTSTSSSDTFDDPISFLQPL